MRLRNSLAAALGALTLVLTLPTSASAAVGDFEYTFIGETGQRLDNRLTDPGGEECINIAEASGDSSSPVFAPRNYTNATATVFVEADCEGDEFYTLNPGKKVGDDLKFRSVVFNG
ncbi:hypothetical protein [Streptomyces sp. NPDC093225]|uniref:hypothetical protein n=1 Tax=Streptomyces sp. NPDC093225 TaxID=3366034 RepID=UPI0038070C8F